MKPNSAPDSDRFGTKIRVSPRAPHLHKLLCSHHHQLSENTHFCFFNQWRRYQQERASCGNSVCGLKHVTLLWPDFCQRQAAAGFLSPFAGNQFQMQVTRCVSARCSFHEICAEQNGLAAPRPTSWNPKPREARVLLIVRVTGHPFSPAV